MVVLDSKRFTGGVDAMAGIEIGGVEPQVDVGHEGSKQNDAVAFLDVMANPVTAHGTLVNSN